MEKARAVHVSIYDLSENYKSTGKDALDNARYALKYLLATKSLRKIENDHNVQVGVPTADELKKSVALEFVSKVEKDAALAQLAVSSICHALTPSVFATVQVKPYLHQHISSRYGKQLERIQSNHKVLVIVPDAQEKSDKILFIFEGEDKSGSKAALDAASEELKKIVADSAEYISKGISIPAKFHDVVRGPRGTTLNAILGPDADVVVLFGTPSAENVEVRGLTKEVNRAIDALQKTYEAAKDEDFTKPYTTEFFIAPTYSAHIIGKSGIHINKLKDDLGVKVDIGENKGEEAEKVVTKGKKSTAPVKVVIQGVRVNVEAAKERIQTQVSSLADQVTISLKVPKEFHRFLIGPSGRYVKKLEDKYNVFIKFPKSNRGDDSPAGNPDEITVRGGKKDAASAKEELMELYEYEKEEQEKRKEREAKHRQYEEKRAAEEKKKAEEKAAKEAAAKESE
jgi:predicted PilT family ATPase